MRKLILGAALAATLMPVAAMAQSYGELRQDRRELRDDRRDLADAYRRGDRDDIRDQRRELRNDRRELRGDRREAWRDWRESHRDVYRMGRYEGPRGYTYRPLVVGSRWDPAFYSQRYWIADPYRYRLPAAGRFERWVRYGNDVVLVNLRTGRIIASYTGFFW